MTRIINLSEIPVLERTHARAGLFRAQALLAGLEGSPDNFFLQLSQTFSDFASPRHRHNFDQVRVQLKSDADFARDGVMQPGMVAYFPEGVFYGPQSISGESLTLVLQLGGASGAGYISEARFQAAVTELQELGRFENGIFKTTKSDGKPKNQDAYEAVWEHVNQCALAYPESSAKAPVFLDPQKFSWVNEPGVAGVQRKLLGDYSDRPISMSILAIEAGTTVSIAAHAIAFVLNGSGLCNTKFWQDHTTFQTSHVPANITAHIKAQVLEIVIPPLMSDAPL